MAFSEDFLTGGEIHPIDMVETLAMSQEWDFDRTTEDQIQMVVTGQWRTYSLTLAWSGADETLRLLATFDMDPPAHRLPALHDVLNRANDEVWTGAFTFWEDQKLMVWRYGLVLAGGQVATIEQVDKMIGTALTAAERFYPAFQLAVWGEETPEAAIKVAIAEAFGRA